VLMPGGPSSSSSSSSFSSPGAPWRSTLLPPPLLSAAIQGELSDHFAAQVISLMAQLVRVTHIYILLTMCSDWCTSMTHAAITRPVLEQTDMFLCAFLCSPL
jgi:hypothetical protein